MGMFPCNSASRLRWVGRGARVIVVLRGELATGENGFTSDGIGSGLSFPFRTSLGVGGFGVLELGDANGFKTADVRGVFDWWVADILSSLVLNTSRVSSG